MHKTVLIFLIFIFITTSYLAVDVMFFTNEGKGNSSIKTVFIEDIIPTDSVFGDLSDPLHFAPVKIMLDKSLLDIEEVGLMPDGQLEVPSTWAKVAWHKESAKAGEKGNVVIGGHYDTDTAVPAAFWGLKNLKVNDTVILQDELRREFSYSIIDTLYVDISDPQRIKIFDETEEAELTLITCGGVWDSVAGTYNKRFVVKAKLL